MSNAATTSFDVPTGSKRLTQGEVARVVKAARGLVEAHERRSPTSEHATLGEEGALWELNFQLLHFRQTLNT